MAMLFKVRVWRDRLAEVRCEVPAREIHLTTPELVARVNEALTDAGYHVRIDAKETDC